MDFIKLGISTFIVLFMANEMAKILKLTNTSSYLDSYNNS